MRVWVAILPAWVFMMMCTGLAQNEGPPAAYVSYGAVGPGLIAWTYFQKPQPLPQSSPVALPDPQAEQAPAHSQAGQAPVAPSQPELSSQTLSGMIVKEGGVYVLKVTDTTVYQLDDQERARAFEDRQVKVTGTLQAGSNMIHVLEIALIS